METVDSLLGTLCIHVLQRREGEGRNERGEREKEEVRGGEEGNWMK